MMYRNILNTHEEGDVPVSKVSFCVLIGIVNLSAVQLTSLSAVEAVWLRMEGLAAKCIIDDVV
jgi:hypothetical protein